MEMTTRIIVLAAFLMLQSFVYANDIETFSLTVKVKGLRSSKGMVQFALYNKDGSIPDKQYKKYYKKQIAKIQDTTAYTTFNGLPKGTYAVSVLHDENMNGKIDKGFILPTEGIGFTNYTTISLGNRPNFKKASFSIISDEEKLIKITYF